MFTGIIETLGTVKDLRKDIDNLHITLTAPFTGELKVDQSVSHNGICLTVVGIDGPDYTVTAIRETIDKTNIKEWSISDNVNLERGMKLGDRLDGHIVQGHVDQVGTCIDIKDAAGSWYYTFEYETGENITIEKGSITVNGVSLTVVDSKDGSFSVAIIPYTKENTTFKSLKIGSKVNLEFDVVGKYVARLHKKSN